MRIYQEVMEETEEIDLEKELEWDSFDKMRLVLRIEEETGKSMDDVLLEVVKAETLKEVVESVGMYIDNMKRNGEDSKFETKK